MRVFVAGASGALGSRLVPQLIDAGHEVIGTYHTPASGPRLAALGAEPVQLDLLDPRAVSKAVLDSKPDAIRPSGDGAGEHQVRPEHGQGLCDHEPVAHRG